MPAWNDTFPAGGLYWSERAFILMFWQAMNERRLARGQAAFAEPPIGANVQSSTTTAPAPVSVTSLTRSGSTVSGTTALAHGFTAGTEIFIQGANETDYNGYWTLATVPLSTTFTFSIGALTPASPATGTITTFRSRFSVRVIQDWLEANILGFIDPAVDIVNATRSTEWRYSLASWRAEAGINSAGFRRRKPREITSTSASTDTNSNAAAIGQRALLTSGGNAGKIHQCTATGPAVWSLIEVRSEQQRVDLSGADDPNGGTWTLTILGNTITGIAWNVSAAALQTSIQQTSGTGANQTTVSKSGFQYTITFPSYLGDVSAVTADGSGLTSGGSISITITETVKGYANVPNADTLDSTTAAPNNVAYGKQVAGDYIDGLTFTELRDGLNAFMRVYGGEPNDNFPYWFARGSGSVGECETEWDADIALGLSDGTSPDGSQSIQGSSPPHSLHTTLPENLFVDVQSELSGEAIVYVRASKIETSPALTLTEFDDFGTGLIEDEFVLHDTIAFSVTGGSTQELTSSLTPSQPPRPSWPASVPGSRGFCLRYGVIVDYDFQYTP